jgi:hypothetical protein
MRSMMRGTNCHAEHDLRDHTAARRAKLLSGTARITLADSAWNCLGRTTGQAFLI